MEKDQAIGAIILIASILGIVIYGWLLFFTLWALIVLQITIFIAVVVILAILAWIGWTMATTPPPKPIEPELTPTTKPEQMPKEEK
ncbi:MAG: transcriptional regulator [archaeon]|nr:transcriptional regulator [archaeon]MCP8320977.1 transcriptional regulator [archaeon]